MLLAWFDNIIISMIEKVRKTIQKQALIKSEETVLCALSGGADSVVLLHVLKQLAEEMNFSLIAAHFNHEIRGESADADEAFVKELCRSWGVECVTDRGNVPEFAKEKGYTIEQAARIMRYGFLENMRADKIAVAHHMNDQAESILMHIIRGSGTAGICGMRYMRGKIIRPLLDVKRSDIESYAAINNLKFCTDATNFIPDGTRNKLRLCIVPNIEREINPCFVDSICSMAQIVRQDDDYLYGLAKKELEKCKLGDNAYDRILLREIDLPLRRRAIRIAAVKAGAFADIEQRHVELIEELLFAKTGAVLNLPHIVVWIAYSKIYFENCEKYDKINSVTEYCVDFCVTGATKIPNGRIESSIVSGNSFERNKNVAYMDLDKLPEKVCVRQRRTGDRLHPAGAIGGKKLKDYFIDKKIERQNRNMPLICCGSDVLCVLGMTVAQSVAVTENTVKMLKVTFVMEDIQ